MSGCVCMRRGAFLLAVPMLAASIALAIPGAARAQERVLRNPNAAIINAGPLLATSEIWIVRGEGSSTSEAERIEVVSPPELTLAQKSALVEGLGKIMVNLGPWSVTPGEPKVPDRLWLSFREVSSLATNENPANTQANVSSYAIFNPPFENHGVWLSFMPPAPGRFLVDCRVKELLSHDQYRVTAYPSGAEQTFSSTNHLLLIYDAVGTGYSSFRIKADGPDEPAWQFYSCEVTPLQP